MSIIYPPEINKIKFDGSFLSGNVISVGYDSLYVYDYAHPQTAINNASAGDIILIYPGTYSPLSGFVADIKKTTYIKGMGESVDDVVLTTPSNIWHTIRVSNLPLNSRVVIENLKSVAERSSSGALVMRENQSDSVVYANNLSLVSNNGYVVYFGDSISHADYKGDAFITNCTIDKGYACYRELGSGSSTSTISVQNTYYPDDYSCYSCRRPPSPHDYVTTPTANYGAGSGTAILELFQYRAFYNGYTYFYNEPISRTVRLYDEGSGTLRDETTSSGIDGSYSLVTTYSGAHYIVCLDNTDEYNHLINKGTLDHEEEVIIV